MRGADRGPVGHEVDPADLGPLPAGVHVEPWVPLTDALAEASVVACHGGSGTAHGALAAGTPMAVLPLFADQPYNARRIARLGAKLEVAEPAAVGKARTRPGAGAQSPAAAEIAAGAGYQR